MALDVEWALSRSAVLLVNSRARSKLECLKFNALGALVALPNRLQNRVFLANVTKPAQALQEPIFQHIALSVTVSRGCYSLIDRPRFDSIVASIFFLDRAATDEFMEKDVFASHECGRRGRSPGFRPP